MHGYMHCILHVIFTYCVNIKIFFTIEGGGKFSEITSKMSFLIRIDIQQVHPSWSYAYVYMCIGLFGYVLVIWVQAVYRNFIFPFVTQCHVKVSGNPRKREISRKFPDTPITHPYPPTYAYAYPPMILW